MKIRFDSIWRNLIRAEPWPARALAVPPIQWHRGWVGDGAKENSREAFRQARVLGAEMCECDVRLTADQIPVICHDPTMQRVWSHPQAVAKLTLSELREIEPGIPTMEEMLKDRQGPSLWNIELKSRTASDPLIRKTAEVVERCGAESRVLFSSFNPLALWLLQDYAPTVPRALLVSDENDPDNAWWLRHMLLVPLLRLHMLNLQDSLLTDEAIRGWQKQGLPISAWTVNEPHRVRTMLDRGVQSVITDLGPKATS